MPGMTDSSRGGWRRWTRLGVLLAVAFVVHDLLMATPVPASAEHAHPAVMAPASDHAARGPVTAHTDRPDPAHPAGCDSVTAAVRQAPARADVDHDGVTPPAALALTARPPAQRVHVTAWDQPYWPPGIRRALFQVYLI